MVPKLVCSLIRHNTHQHGDKPVCVQLFDENRMLHASVERLIKENDKLLDILKNRDIMIEALKRQIGKPWWRFWK